MASDTGLIDENASGSPFSGLEGLDIIHRAAVVPIFVTPEGTRHTLLLQRAEGSNGASGLFEFPGGKIIVEEDIRGLREGYLQHLFGFGELLETLPINVDAIIPEMPVTSLSGTDLSTFHILINAIREMIEETGINLIPTNFYLLDATQDLVPWNIVNNGNGTFGIYNWPFTAICLVDTLPEVIFSQEHTSFRWFELHGDEISIPEDIPITDVTNTIIGLYNNHSHSG